MTVKTAPDKVCVSCSESLHAFQLTVPVAARKAKKSSPVGTALAAVLPSESGAWITKFDEQPPEILTSMLLRSSITDHIAALLRNDCLEDDIFTQRQVESKSILVRAAAMRIVAFVRTCCSGIRSCASQQSQTSATSTSATAYALTATTLGRLRSPSAWVQPSARSSRMRLRLYPATLFAFCFPSPTISLPYYHSGDGRQQ